MRSNPKKRRKILALREVAKNRRKIVLDNDARLAEWIARLFPASYKRLAGFERGLNLGVLRTAGGNG